MSMPANVSAIFSKYPAAQTVLVEMGHAYGKSRFAGRCPVSGVSFGPGRTVRHLVVWTRDGKLLDGYATSEGCAMFGFCGGTDGELSWSRVTRWTPESFAALDLAAMPVGTRITVWKAGGYGPVDTSWQLDGLFGWVNLGTRGKSTAKQLASTFARTKAAIAFAVDTRP